MCNLFTDKNENLQITKNILTAIFYGNGYCYQINSKKTTPESQQCASSGRICKYNLRFDRFLHQNKISQQKKVKNEKFSNEARHV